jgi:hypothetical protein
MAARAVARSGCTTQFTNAPKRMPPDRGRRARRRARRVERPREVAGIGADGEADALGMARRERDHLGAGGGDLERHLRRLRRAQPLEPAREAVAIDLGAAEIALQPST